ncbi:MAG: GAF domain-containing protein [Deltaproteobacteria bacterium]|nr:GAF domain-containing protein [Deltaproteobacteria bacterium]
MPASARPRVRARQLAIAVYTLVAVTIAVGALANSFGWINRTFPGFFLMDNRVVPSVGLAHWTGLQEQSIYQHELVRLDGRPVASARDVYDAVAAEPPGTPFHYELATRHTREKRTIASMRFSLSDYVSLFGAYFLNGVIFTGVGLAVWILGPVGATTTGTVVLVLNAGAFVLTGMDLYGPAALFRLHVTTEALLPATFLHLMLVFPVLRLGRYRRAVLAAVYAADLAVVAIYQVFLYDADTYSRVHNLCMSALGFAGVGLIVSGIYAYWTSSSVLVRKRLGIVLLGIVTGFAIPAWLVTMSGLSGGEQPVNLAAFTAFLFPLSLAYAVVKLDLFEIDAVLRRGVNYLLLSGIVMLIYAVLGLGLGVALQTTSVTHSPAFPLIFSLLMIGLLTPMREAVQRTVDRLYYRTSHNAQKTLERASGALVTMLNVEEIYALTLQTICEALLIERAAVWLRGADGSFALVRGRALLEELPAPIPPEHALVVRLQRTVRAMSVYDFADDLSLGTAERACRALLEGLGADLVLPLRVRGELSGFIVLGAKKSGTLFTLDDLDFLHTFANQASVAIVNALSYRKIEELNVGLEHKVTQRTQELATTNRELARSLGELERAYHELQRSQENLVHAEKMAALGRLTAGIAHEVNTPLGASLNALKMIGDLVGEYRVSIGDTTVTEDDHRELAAELYESVENVAKWTTKAAGYIRSIKAHTRNLDAVQERPFDLPRLIEDTRLLLSHRLRLSSCSVTVDCPQSLMLYGDPGKLGQVLTNLITNAIDAYEDHGSADGRIVVEVEATSEEVAIAVQDTGCGIAPEHLDRIFEELFTTKPPGKGTGLGLSISRDIVSDCFDGRIEVTSTPRVGSRFTLRLPRREPDEREAGRTAANA